MPAAISARSSRCKKAFALARLVTSIRRDQTPARAGALKVHWDAKFHLVKINPFADWTYGKSLALHP